MAELKDKYGRLTPIQRIGKEQLLCKCDCGQRKTVRLYSVLNGHTMSCGCLRREMTASKNTTHGLSRTPAHISWKSMMVRCYNTNTAKYQNYGARGIKVCDRWHKFENFLEDMGPRPENKTLDRIDVNGNYEPENCRWADTKQQAQNKTTNVILSFNGLSLCLMEWSRKTGIDRRKISDRIKRGWSVERALTAA